VAERSGTTGSVQKIVSRPGRDAGLHWSQSLNNAAPAPIQGAIISELVFRWFRFAPPPANLPSASGAEELSNQSHWFSLRNISQ
jgi:hypothetical protein